MVLSGGLAAGRPFDSWEHWTIVDIWSSLAVSLFLLFCALGMMVMHVRGWRSVQAQGPEEDELGFRRRQFRRRMQSSAMLGLLAVAIFAGQLIKSPALAIAFWGATLLLLVWVGLLAVGDILATKYHFGRVRRNYRIEQAKLEAELHRIRDLRRNGKGQKKGRRRGGKGNGPASGQ